MAQERNVFCGDRLASLTAYKSPLKLPNVVSFPAILGKEHTA